LLDSGEEGLDKLQLRRRLSWSNFLKSNSAKPVFSSKSLLTPYLENTPADTLEDLSCKEDSQTGCYALFVISKNPTVEMMSATGTHRRKE
jgi:hypothetical protein